MKRFFIIMLSVLMILGCTNEPAPTHGNLRIAISSEGQGEYVTAYYLVTILNMDSNVSYGTEKLTGSSPEKELSVVAGNTRITAEAYNSKNEIIGSASGDMNVKAGEDNLLSLPVRIKGFSISTSAMNLDDKAHTETFKVTRNTEDSTYEITGRPDWITIKEKVSSGLVDTITLSISQNTAEEARSVSLKIGSKTLLITQKGSLPVVDDVTGIASILPGELEFEASDAGIRTFTVTRENGTAYDYEVKAEESWINVKSRSTDGLADVWEVSVSDNESDLSRTGSISVGNLSVSVYQKPRKTDLLLPQSIVIDSIYPQIDSEIVYKDMVYQVKAHVLPETAPQEIEFKLTSNGTNPKDGPSDRKIPDNWMESYTYLDQNGNFSIPYDYWLPGTNDNGKWSKNFTLTISAKNHPEVSEKIIFSVDRDTNAKIIDVTPSRIELQDSTAKVREISVNTSTAGSTIVKVKSAPAWIRITEKDLTGTSRTFSLEIAPHRGTKDREGKIVFVDNNNNEKSIVVSQKADPAKESQYVWLSGISIDESEFIHKTTPSGSRYFHINEEYGVNNGWYLVAKSKLNQELLPHMEDGSMCWAMAASASIHWWADHNREYIDKFAKLHPEVLEPQKIDATHTKPAMDFKYDNTVELVKDKSSIAKIYVDNHFDEGDDPYQALLDMLFVPRMPRDVKHKANATYPGWFQEVFKGREKEVVKDTPILNIQDLHFLMEDSIENNTSLILTYYLKSAKGHHAVNIWGVRYDEDGNISELVIGDNNSVTDDRLHPAVSFLNNVLVRENENGYVDIGNADFPDAKTYMGQITKITSLSLGTEIWEEWSRKN